jgi:hypothetical protein
MQIKKPCNKNNLIDETLAISRTIGDVIRLNISLVYNVTAI